MPEPQSHPSFPSRSRRPVAGVLGVLLLGLFALRSLDAASPAELEELRARVAGLKARLESVLASRDAEEAALRKVETGLGVTVRRLVALERERAPLVRERTALRASGERLSRDLEARREAAALLARAAFAVGRSSDVRFLLGREDAVAAGRALAYVRYLHAATSRELEALWSREDDLARVRESLAENVRRIDSSIDGERSVKAHLEDQRVERGRVLARLNLRIQDDRETLEHLRRDAERLSRLVTGLVEALPAALEAAERETFASRRGRLSWPVSGKVIHRFGTPRPSGNLAWQGVWIRAEAGTPVHAASHGRVAFAEWLRGFGLMLILDHGDGYMSLYGHNSTLLKDTGAWVDGGEEIARVGDSGGLTRPGLYFEVRSNGRPLDPQGWLGPPAGPPRPELVRR